MPTSQDILNSAIVRLKQHMENAEFLMEVSLVALIKLVELEQQTIAEIFHLSEIEIRKLSENNIKQLMDMIQQEGGGKLILRHGGQDPGMAIVGLNSVQQKILMMQRDHNVGDPTSIQSALESIGTLWTIVYLKRRLNSSIIVHSSINCRAKQPASAIAQVLSIPLQLSSTLDCINYPDQLDPLLMQKLQGGTLPWNETIVDEVVGQGTFRQILTGMQQIKDQFIPKNQINIFITHTQQIQAFLQLSQPDSNPNLRLSFYGFLFATQKKFLLFQEGFYSTDLLILQPEATTSLSFQP